MASIRDYVTKRYGDKIRSDSMISHEKVIAEFIDLTSSKNILEVGTSNGLSAALWASLGLNVITLDIKHSEIAPDLWEQLGLQERISYHVFGSNEEKANFIEKQNFEMVFIDGDHSKEGVQFDYQCTSRCGLVLFHDYKPDQDRYQGLVEFVDSLRPRNFTFGASHSKFALWISTDHSLRNNQELMAWLAQE